MGDAGRHPLRRIYLLRAAAGVVALSMGAALAVDLFGKATEPRPAATTASPHPPPAKSSKRERPTALAAQGRTIYGSLDDLDECARSSRTVGAASRRPGVDDDVTTISRRVERIRNLEFEKRVDTRLLTRADVSERFVRGYRRDVSNREAETRSRVLAALRLVPEGFDLEEAGARLLGEGVAGFYNDRSGRLFAGATAGALAPFDEVVLAHELDHALVDQVLGLPRTAAENPRRGDAALAHQALVEGDATLTMSKYASARLPADEAAAFLARFSGGPVTPPAEVPYVLSRVNEYPYFEGLLLACAAWERGGWKEIDRMYDRPPGTTAEVLFPARYVTGAKTVPPPEPGEPGRSWERSLSASFGAFDLMLLLENADVLRNGSARFGSHVEQVRGWVGGMLTAWTRDVETAVHLGVVDGGVATRSGTRRGLCGALRRWVIRSFPEGAGSRNRSEQTHAWTTSEGTVALRCEGPSVELALAPAGRLARRVLGS